MAELNSIVQKVRTKNAGPFWLTIDIFCGSVDVYQTVVEKISNKRIAALLCVEENTIKRFEISSLNVVKISLPRPTVQGSIKDRDMHGASWGALIGEMEL